MSTPRAAAVRPRSVPRARDAAVADVLARAFWDDPVMAYLLPDEASRYRRLVRFYRFAIEDGRRRGLVHTTDDEAAVTVWHAPGHRKITTTDILTTAPMGLSVFGLTGLSRATGTFDVLSRHHARAPHWYLSLVGTDPVRRGSGAARGLLDAVLGLADDEGLGAYLESSKEANVAYYERLGFGVTEVVSLPDGGPQLWLMWRDPRPSAP